MKRTDAITAIRIAGYHGDARAYCRLYAESRVSRAAAETAWQAGVQQKLQGMKCACPTCAKETK
jgi:hypothetical protein